MLTPITLCDLPRGRTAQVLAVTAKGAMRRRLQDVGLSPGATVTCVNRGMWGGPVALLVRGAVIALRRQDAAGILAEMGKESCPWDNRKRRRDG